MIAVMIAPIAVAFLLVEIADPHPAHQRFARLVEQEQRGPVRPSPYRGYAGQHDMEDAVHVAGLLDVVADLVQVFSWLWMRWSGVSSFALRSTWEVWAAKRSRISSLALRWSARPSHLPNSSTASTEPGALRGTPTQTGKPVTPAS